MERKTRAQNIVNAKRGGIIMDWLNYVLSVLTLIAGGGWFVNYRAKKMQAEADGWKSQQEVYQRTIADLEKSCEFIRADRDLLRKENEELRAENMDWHKKFAELSAKFQELQEKVARQGRRIEALTKESKKKQ